MTITKPEYVLAKSTNGTRLLNAQTGETFSSVYQRTVRADEVEAALTAYHKYKTKQKLDGKALISIKAHVLKVSADRRGQGKLCPNKFLIQTACAFAKTLNAQQK